jgi:hypothetical protein
MAQLQTNARVVEKAQNTADVPIGPATSISVTSRPLTTTTLPRPGPNTSNAHSIQASQPQTIRRAESQKPIALPPAVPSEPSTGAFIWKY